MWRIVAALGTILRWRCVVGGPSMVSFRNVPHFLHIERRADGVCLYGGSREGHAPDFLIGD